MNLHAVLTKIIDEEGFSRLVYRDTFGVRKIGIGLNLDEATAQGTCAARGLDWDKLASGEVAISYSDAVQIATHMILCDRFAAGCVIPNFESLPEAVQLVVLDMEFEMGHTLFASCNETIAAINRGDYQAAAAHMRATAWWYEQVPSRAERDCQLMESASQGVAK